MRWRWLLCLSVKAVNKSYPLLSVDHQKEDAKNSLCRSWPKTTKKRLKGGADPTDNVKKTVTKKRSEGVDQDHPPLPPPPLGMTIGVSTVPTGGGGGHDHVPIPAVTVTIVTAMPEGNIPKNPNDGAKVKNGVDLLANERASTKAVEVIAKRTKRRKSLANEVIDRKGIDHHHHLNRHHLLLRIVVVGMMMTQMFVDLPFQEKRSKCTLTNRQMIWYGTRLERIS